MFNLPCSTFANTPVVYTRQLCVAQVAISACFAVDTIQLVVSVIHVFNFIVPFTSRAAFAPLNFAI